MGPALPAQDDTALPVPPWPTGDLEGITAELRAQVAGPDRDGTALALLQWGVAAVMAGDLATALYAFGRCRERGHERAELAGAVPPATAGLALTHALLGDVEIARAWLADPAVAELPPAGPDDLTDTARRIARALVAIDALDDDLDDVVDAMGSGTAATRSGR